MVRIKGANSDYQFSTKSQQIVEVQPKPSPVYLQIFVCPYDMPSRIEPPQDGKWCEGTDSACPHQGQKSGHAMLRLHQKEGVSLIADRNSQLILDQEGSIHLSPAAPGVIEANGTLVLRQPGSKDVSLKVSSQGFELQAADGAVIRLDRDGNLELSPAPGKTVNIKGDLSVQGQITGKLADSVKQALIEEIKKSLGK
jgi:hypothetical protein